MSKSPLEKIKVDQVQKKIIEDFADIISEETGLTVLVIKGFLWKTLRQWQKTHGMTITDTEKGSGSSPNERIQQATDILNICKSKIESSTDVNIEDLETGIKKSIRHYDTHYAKR
ncbi:MAG: hypothetical protein ACXACW_06640 [Candidatus Hodarchaeales archaeon]|jgi:hypothetical protein